MTSSNIKIDLTAFVDPTAEISEGCVIDSNAKVYGKVKLAKNVWLASNSIIYGPAEIGENTCIGTNVTVGHPSRKEFGEILKARQMDPKLRSGRPVKIGKNVLIRSNCTIYSDVTIGDYVQFGHNAMVREGVTVGATSLIGTNVIIDGECMIGRGVSIQTGVYICTYSTVENFVLLGPNCTFTNDKFVGLKKCKLRGPVVREGAGIGAATVLLPGITVGKEAVVGAGAVVTRSVPSRLIVAGIPAKKLKLVPRDWESLLRKQAKQQINSLSKLESKSIDR